MFLYPPRLKAGDTELFYLSREVSRDALLWRAQRIPEVFLVDMCAVFLFPFSNSKLRHSNGMISIPGAPVQRAK
jgi:hypothetical protein